MKSSLEIMSRKAKIQPQESLFLENLDPMKNIPVVEQFLQSPVHGRDNAPSPPYSPNAFYSLAAAFFASASVLFAVSFKS